MSDDNRVAWPIVEAIDAAAVRLARENADLRAMLREIRRTVIASVRDEEHAAALTDEEVDAHAASTPVDVGNLVARMRSAEAERDALSNFSRNNEAALATAVDQLALLRAQVAALAGSAAGLQPVAQAIPRARHTYCPGALAASPAARTYACRPSRRAPSRSATAATVDRAAAHSRTTTASRPATTEAPSARPGAEAASPGAQAPEA
jgi:hypothetical protein